MKLNLSPQTFKSHYRFYTSEATSDLDLRFMKLERNEDFQYNTIATDDVNDLMKGVYGEGLISADDKYDKKIERILASRGIDFKKTPLQTLRNKDNILSRIELDSYDKAKDYYLLDIDVKKFDELFKKDNQYIGRYGERGIDTRYADFIRYIDTGLPIHASKVIIKEEDGEPKISFIDGRHRYSVMRDMGFDGIPVSLDESSKLIAEKYGLLK